MPSKIDRATTTPGARMLCVAFLIGLAACDATKAAGSGGAGGITTAAGGHTTATGSAGGAGGFTTATGGAGGGGGFTTATGGAGGHTTATGGAGGFTTAAGGAGGAQATCTFSATYTLTEGGGLAANQEETLLSPPAMFQYARQSFITGSGTQSCAPALPACGSPTSIDVSDVEAAMADADVQAAFATAPPLDFGLHGVADGPSFGVERSTGGSFSIGIECTDASSTCLPTPPGVHTLVQLLHDLITQQLTDPSCASVQN